MKNISKIAKEILAQKIEKIYKDHNYTGLDPEKKLIFYIGSVNQI